MTRSAPATDMSLPVRRRRPAMMSSTVCEAIATYWSDGWRACRPRDTPAVGADRRGGAADLCSRSCLGSTPQRGVPVHRRPGDADARLFVRDHLGQAVVKTSLPRG